MIKVRTNGVDAGQLEAALVRYAETGSAADQAECIRLYEAQTRFKAGCGVCIAGRSLFIKGLADIASGNAGDGMQKMRGALKSASVKFDILRGKLGL